MGTRLVIATAVLTLVSGESRLYPQQPGGAPVLFAQNCAACHGATGVPNAAMSSSMGIPDFTDAHGVTTKPDSVLRASVIAGKGKMPAFRGRFTPAQVRALVVYIRTLRRPAR